MKKKVILVAVLLSAAFSTTQLQLAHSFCGFYVAKGNAKLFNKTSQVVLVRHDNKTVVTMANDFKGNLKEFAVVIPVPTFIEKGQIHLGDRNIIEHLDAYTAPRLVEYFDEKPCERYGLSGNIAPPKSANLETQNLKERTLGVMVEAEYTIGEYDIMILSARESEGLEIWLKENGYRIPEGATSVLGSYIKQNMRFLSLK